MYIYVKKNKINTPTSYQGEQVTIMFSMRSKNCKYCIKNLLNIAPTTQQCTLHINQELKGNKTTDRYRKENMKPGNKQHG
jgi:hypothetical protein